MCLQMCDDRTCCYVADEQFSPNNVSFTCNLQINLYQHENSIRKSTAVPPLMDQFGPKYKPNETYKCIYNNVQRYSK